MSQALVDPSFLFRFRVPCLYRKVIWDRNGVELEPQYTLPYLGELNDRKPIAEVRAAWSEQGMTFFLKVQGKKQVPWCRESRPEDCDGLHLWIDTRDTKSIHRASRFCHRFLFAPHGTGFRMEEPFATMLRINRAKEDPKSFGSRKMVVKSTKIFDGYELAIHIPAECLSGYAPDEQPQIGFYYAVSDHEQGMQPWLVGEPFPITEDPSIWGTLELVR